MDAPVSMPAEPAMDAPNMLIHEQSPYLLQHAYNPVAWEPWSDQAFERAAAEDKPLFVSIGYAACHWCHVMERESFEDADVAAYLNEHFISVKVDREERPDVDALCMDVCQTMTGHGGWPLTIFMDSERRPFMAGTYFPRESSQGRLGFLDLLNRIHDVWSTDRGRAETAATEIMKSLQQSATIDFSGTINENIFADALDHHERMFDAEHGGFSTRPKFPSPHHLLLLMRIANDSKACESNENAVDAKSVLAMVTQTLDAMRAGGMYDHVGFGFHRYSTDSEWLVPHFEKMLYDQAMLMMAYAEAFQITRDETYKQVVLEIAEFLRRDMTSSAASSDFATSNGAFLSAHDADSEGEEGKYYVWSFEELEPLTASLFNARAEGNFHDEATGERTGMNILHVHRTQLRTVMGDNDWKGLRTQLLARRNLRVKPLVDDKILMDWNGLMIGALARASRALGGDTVLLKMAEDAYAAVTRSCYDAVSDTWWHRYRNGNRAVRAMLDDHAMFGWAAAELYQCSGNDAYVTDARRHADIVIVDFMDSSESSDRARAPSIVSRASTDVPVRQRDAYDSAYPCGNSMTALLFAQLGAIAHAPVYEEAARTCVLSYAQQINRASVAFCMLLCVWHMIRSRPSTISINSLQLIPGDNDSRNERVGDIRTDVLSAFLPSAVIVHSAAHSTDTVIVCRSTTCSAPLTKLNEVIAAVEGEVT